MCADRSACPRRTVGAFRRTKLAPYGAGFVLFGLGVFAGHFWRSGATPTANEARTGSASECPHAIAPNSSSFQIVSYSAGDAWPPPIEAAGAGDVTESALKAALVASAQRDPRGALERAAREPNWRLREILRNAALQGWAMTQPASAGDFALALPEQERAAAIAAVFAGAARNPEATVQLAQHVCAMDPARAEENGRAAIEALGEVGAFAFAVRFAAATESDNRVEWLRTAFSQWSGHLPAAALKALAAVESPDARVAAFQGLALGWAQANPKELADFAVALPAGDDRAFGLREALSHWLAHDPAAAADWIDRFEPREEFDLGAAQLAVLPAIAKPHPDVALSWAASIVEPTLRSSTLALVGHQWAESSPEARSKLMEAASALPPTDRQALIDGIQIKTTE